MNKLNKVKHDGLLTLVINGKEWSQNKVTGRWMVDKHPCLKNDVPCEVRAEMNHRRRLLRKHNHILGLRVWISNYISDCVRVGIPVTNALTTVHNGIELAGVQSYRDSMRPKWSVRTIKHSWYIYCPGEYISINVSLIMWRAMRIRRQIDRGYMWTVKNEWKQLRRLLIAKYPTCAESIDQLIAYQRHYNRNYDTGLRGLYYYDYVSRNIARRVNGYVSPRDILRTYKIAVSIQHSHNVEQAANKFCRAWDEHGQLPFGRKKYLDYVDPQEAEKHPYLDLGGLGLLLIELTTTSGWRQYGNRSYPPSKSTTRYILGRNEVGTMYAHAVGKQCATVAKAIDWIWHGKSKFIIRRQGDIAIVSTRINLTNKGVDKLPASHVKQSDGTITHTTHPTIAGPGCKEQVIVGRRAADYVVGQKTGRKE